MKTEWQFRYETRDFIFEKVHNFKGENTDTVDFGFGEVSGLKFDVRIEPEPDQEWTHGVMQTGKMLITLPFNVDEARPIAMFLSEYVRERIAFDSGDFTINYGVVYAERIPETPEEVNEVGDTPHAAFMQFEEVDMSDVPSFNSSAFKESSSKPTDVRLMSQFNAASKESSIISQFLGYYKILESMYSSPKTHISLRRALTDSTELEGVFKKTLSGGTFENFVNETVDIRDECAHLRMEQGFGYSPLDTEIKDQVEPYIEPLKELTYNCIRSI